VVRACAALDEGIDDLVAAIDAHRDWLTGRGELIRRREARAAAQIEAIVLAAVAARMRSLRDESLLLDRLAAAVVTGELDVYAAARQLLDALSNRAQPRE
jgi:LAO/AO transport system kinase